MLTKFSVKNFKNFKDRLVFDFTNTKYYEFSEKCIKNQTVKNAIVYGKNGCGKSNLAFAIFDIVAHLTDMEVNKDGYIDYINAEAIDSLAEFKYEFMFDNSVLEYSYGKTNIRTLVFEELKIDNKILIQYDKRDINQVFFETKLSGTETLDRELSRLRISVLKYIKTSTVLANNHQNEVLFHFFDFIDRMLHFRSLEDRFYQGYEIGFVNINKYIADKHIKEFNDFLKDAASDIEVIKETIAGEARLFMKFNNAKIDFFSNVSTGTLTLTLFYFWLKRMEDHAASFLFIDEFDAFYHQELSEFVVRKLQELDCQAVLTTHNTRLLSNDLMRPDCCFILKNGKIEPLSSLTDKELREAHNIEKMYRAKVFDK